MSKELFNAIYAHDAKRVFLLLSQGANPNELLEEPPHWYPLEAIIEEVDHDGSMEVILEIIRLLIQHGADVNAKYDHMDCCTPLLTAIYWENKEAVRIFIKAGADPNVFTEDGESPLRWAIEEDYLEMAALFLDNGADKSINEFGGFTGLTPLGMAADMLNLSMIKLLLDAGADSEALDESGRTARDILPPRDKSDPEVWDTAMEMLSLGRN